MKTPYPETLIGFYSTSSPLLSFYLFFSLYPFTNKDTPPLDMQGPRKIAPMQRLAAKFSEITKTRSKAALFCVLLVDGSGSIRTQDFEGQLKCGLSLLVESLQGAAVAVMQFATNTRLESPATKITQELKQKIAGEVFFFVPAYAHYLLVFSPIPPPQR